MSEVKLPAGWVEIKCSEFCSGRNKTFNPSTARESSYVLYSVPSHATGQPEVVTPKEIGSSKQHVSAGDTLISKINPRLNRTWVVGEHPNQTVIASTEWIVFAASEAFIPAFLALFLQQARVRDFLSHNASGVGGSLTRIKPAIFDQVSLPLPPLPEQKRIVAKIEELFSELDAGEESLRRARRQLGVYRQSLLKQAFEGKLTTPWRAQHPDLLESPDQLLARIQAERQARYQQQLKEWEKACKQSEKLGDSVQKPTKPKLITPPQQQPDSTSLPDEWTWVDLGILKQFSLYGPRFSSDDYSEDGVCVLRTSDIGESGKVNLSTAPRLQLNPVELYQYGCQKGDILITRTGSLGTLAVFNDDVDSIPGAYLIQYRLVAAHYAPFLYHFLRGPVGQSALTGGGAGVGRPNLNAPTIEAIPIPLCSLPEQQEIVRLLDAQFEVIEQNEREIDAALKRSEALRQSILKKAFTGQLVPQDPTDEPASALLERIRNERERSAASKQPKKKVALKRLRFE